MINLFFSLFDSFFPFMLWLYIGFYFSLFHYQRWHCVIFMQFKSGNICKKINLKSPDISAARFIVRNSRVYLATQRDCSNFRVKNSTCGLQTWLRLGNIFSSVTEVKNSPDAFAQVKHVAPLNLSKRNQMNVITRISGYSSQSGDHVRAVSAFHVVCHSKVTCSREAVCYWFSFISGCHCNKHQWSLSSVQFYR